MKIASPGNVVIHQPDGSNSRALESIEPQDATFGGTPKPRNDSPDSVRMAAATPKVAETKIGAMAFGRTCRKMIRGVVKPMA